MDKEQLQLTALPRKENGKICNFLKKGERKLTIVQES